MRIFRKAFPILAAVFLFSGCGHSPSGTSEQSASSGGGAAAPAAKQGPVPNFDTTPLTQADVDLYIDVMTTAANYVKNPSASDRAAMDFAAQVTAGKVTTAISPVQAQMLARTAVLAQYDMEIAKQRGISARYEAIRGAVEGLVGMMACPTCSGDGGTTPVNQTSSDLTARQSAQKIDLALLQPHSAEIVSLQKQLRGIMMNGQQSH
jgi:hypothetical protein